MYIESDIDGFRAWLKANKKIIAKYLKESEYYQPFDEHFTELDENYFWGQNKGLETKMNILTLHIHGKAAPDHFASNKVNYYYHFNISYDTHFNSEDSFLVIHNVDQNLDNHDKNSELFQTVKDEFKKYVKVLEEFIENTFTRTVSNYTDSNGKYHNFTKLYANINENKTDFDFISTTSMVAFIYWYVDEKDRQKNLFLPLTDAIASDLQDYVGSICKIKLVLNELNKNNIHITYNEKDKEQVISSIEMFFRTKYDSTVDWFKDNKSFYVVNHSIFRH